MSSEFDGQPGRGEASEDMHRFLAGGSPTGFESVPMEHSPYNGFEAAIVGPGIQLSQEIIEPSELAAVKAIGADFSDRMDYLSEAYLLASGRHQQEGVKLRGVWEVDGISHDVSLTTKNSEKDYSHQLEFSRSSGGGTLQIVQYSVGINGLLIRSDVEEIRNSEGANERTINSRRLAGPHEAALVANATEKIFSDDYDVEVITNDSENTDSIADPTVAEGENGEVPDNRTYGVWYEGRDSDQKYVLTHEESVRKKENDSAPEQKERLRKHQKVYVANYDSSGRFPFLEAATITSDDTLQEELDLKKWSDPDDYPDAGDEDIVFRAGQHQIFTEDELEIIAQPIIDNLPDVRLADLLRDPNFTPHVELAHLARVKAGERQTEAANRKNKELMRQKGLIPSFNDSANASSDTPSQAEAADEPTASCRPHYPNLSLSQLLAMVEPSRNWPLTDNDGSVQRNIRSMDLIDFDAPPVDEIDLDRLPPGFSSSGESK